MCVCAQVKYKEAGKKEASSALYHQLPETAETLHAKQLSELHSQVTTSFMLTPNVKCHRLSHGYQHSTFIGHENKL